MKIENRATFGWPATTAASAPCDKGLVIHYDGATKPRGVAGWSHERCRQYWQDTRKFHMGPARGWRDIGYSYGVCPHGTVLEGRGWQREQAAQPGGNASWTSVTLMLGEGEDPTAAQVEGVRELRAWLRGKGLGATVRGHRDFVSTSCPGDRLYGRLADFAKDPTKIESKEEDVATPKDIWAHEIDAPWDERDPKWNASTHLRVMHSHVRALGTKVDALAADQAETKALLAEAIDLLRAKG